MGDGGVFSEKVFGNLKVLVNCVKDQKVKYDYFYMDGFKMDCVV